MMVPNQMKNSNLAQMNEIGTHFFYLFRHDIEWNRFRSERLNKLTVLFFSTERKTKIWSKTKKAACCNCPFECAHLYASMLVVHIKPIINNTKCSWNWYERSVRKTLIPSNGKCAALHFCIMLFIRANETNVNDYYFNRSWGKFDY